MPVGGNHGRKPPNPHHVPKSHGKKPAAPPPHKARPKQGCCAMAAAGRALRRGKYRLASRYARLSIQLIAARLAS